MALQTGSMTIADLLAAQFISPARFGLDTIEQVLNRDLAVHNQIVLQLMGDMVEVTTDRQRITGASTEGQMTEVDEYGRAPTQRPNFGSTVAFPMRKFQYNIGWTRDWLKNHTPKDMALQTINAQKAHLLKIRFQMMNAIFGAANFAFRDFLRDNIPFTIRRFLNADGSAIPDGPNGEVYNPNTHNHYTAISALTGTAFIANVENVLEHGLGGKVLAAINRNDETTVRGLTGFQPYIDPRIQLGYGQVPDQNRLDISRLDNRAIGILGPAEVWVKPWCPQYYSFAWDQDSVQKPLCMRVPEGAAGPNLAIAAQLDGYPLYAQFMEDYFGFGAYTRTNGAVLYFNGSSYVSPVFTG